MSFQQLMMLACSCRSGLLLLRPVAWNWTALYRLKLLKRSMYGRANHDLLRQRVLAAA